MTTTLTKYNQYSLQQRWLSPRENTSERVVWLMALGILAIQEQTAINQTILEQFTLLVQTVDHRVRHERFMGRMTPAKQAAVKLHLEEALQHFIAIARQANMEIQNTLSVRR